MDGMATRHMTKCKEQAVVRQEGRADESEDSKDPVPKAHHPVRGMKNSGSCRLCLALQGGGAHGAFIWGVLDRLLEDDRIIIEGVSGTRACLHRLEPQ
jgi:NTE family protein